MHTQCLIFGNRINVIYISSIGSIKIKEHLLKTWTGYDIFKTKRISIKYLYQRAEYCALDVTTFRLLVLVLKLLSTNGSQISLVHVTNCWIHFEFPQVLNAVIYTVKFKDNFGEVSTNNYDDIFQQVLLWIFRIRPIPNKPFVESLKRNSFNLKFQSTMQTYYSWVPLSCSPI